MNEDDLREFELALDTYGRLSLEDAWRLIQEVRRLRAAEREAVCVLGAIVSQHDGWRVAVPEEALRRGFTVERVPDPVSLRVVFWAHTEEAGDGEGAG